MSIEETNRVRASLGLRPLDVGEKPEAPKEGTSKNPVSYMDMKKAEEEEAKAKELREKIADMKRSRQAQAEATDEALAQGLSAEDAALAGSVAAASSTMATAVRAVQRNYDLTCVEEENAKQLAGQGGCYAFYYDTAASKLTISLHLLQDAPNAAEMAVAALAHTLAEGKEEEEDAAVLSCSAAENGLTAVQGEWGLQRSKSLNKVLFCLNSA